jgi:hypothetical protein
MICLFMFGLFNDAVSSSDYIASNDRIMNWKVYGRKRSWPNLRYYSGICLEELRKTTNTLSQGSRSLGRDLNSRPPEYKAGVLTTRTRTRRRC